MVTPWKTWLSCEEIPTGLVWECDPFGIQAARPLEDSYRILRNTTFNCAGVVTPWKTWLSCEEIPTGLVWECDPFGIQAARPLELSAPQRANQ
ncbi:alkaline phosphatase PhoX [Mycobacterium tuberculosis]|uniref:alkaline phosphatase PhoX n=1 Tax=Mycobacterium tuberculosis TaxID=1773 RepID=UPI00350F307A